jgi:hypothetical protein
MLMVIAPFAANKKLRYEFPNNFIAWICIGVFFANLGLLMGVATDFDPDRYAGTEMCGLQAFFIYTFAVWALLMVFFYIVGLYQIVVLRQQGRHMTHQTRWIVVGSFLVSFIFNTVIPLAVPVEFEDGSKENFWSQGPWCGPANSIVLIVGFYLPTVPPSLLSIFMAVKIIIVVFKTTKATATFSSGAMESPGRSGDNNESAHRKRARERKRQLQRFYARVSLFVIFFCAATVISFLTRLRGLLDDYDDTGPNDKAMGTSIAIPILALIEGMVLLSTPAVSRFYTRHLPGVKPLSSTTEGSSAGGTITPGAALEPSTLKSKMDEPNPPSQN